MCRNYFRGGVRMTDHCGTRLADAEDYDLPLPLWLTALIGRPLRRREGSPATPTAGASWRVLQVTPVFAMEESAR